MYKPIDMDSLKLNNNFKWVITKDDFFTKDECEYIINKVNKNSERKKTKYYEKEDSICLLNINKNIEQKYLDKFYRDLGFYVEGEEYLEDGIPHQRMLLEI